MKIVKHFIDFAKAITQRLFCKHKESSTSSCPFTGRTYTTSVDSDSVQMGGWLGTTTTSGTGGNAGFVDTSGFTSSYIQFSAEL